MVLFNLKNYIDKFFTTRLKEHKANVKLKKSSKLLVIFGYILNLFRLGKRQNFRHCQLSNKNGIRNDTH